MSDYISRDGVMSWLDDNIDGSFLWAALRTHIAKMPAVNPAEPCGDCISRQALQEWIKDKTFGDIGVASEHNFDCLPSVEPERKQGHWEWNQRTGEYVCSECGCNPIYERTTPDCSEIDKYKFCRWCGAKMEVQNGKENS